MDSNQLLIWDEDSLRENGVEVTASRVVVEVEEGDTVWYLNVGLRNRDQSNRRMLLAVDSQLNDQHGLTLDSRIEPLQRQRLGRAGLSYAKFELVLKGEENPSRAV